MYRQCRAINRLRLSHNRLFHSYEHAPADRYNQAEQTILKAAMTHVPQHGFSLRAIQNGATDTGHLEITHNLFPKGAFELIRYHLITERLALQHVEIPAHGVGKKVRSLLAARIKANEQYIHQWQDALAVMSLPSNIPGALEELHNLSDEIWHLVDDQSADMAWYTKRASLSSIYASTDLFMTQDSSPEYRDTYAFLDRRLNEVHTIGSSISEVSTFVGFQLWQASNILASKGFKL